MSHLLTTGEWQATAGEIRNRRDVTDIFGYAASDELTRTTSFAMSTGEDNDKMAAMRNQTKKTTVAAWRMYEENVWHNWYWLSIR